MSGYEGRCPSCGAAVVFSLGATVLKICEHCGSAIAREGANLASYGKVAARIPTMSILRLGVEGRRQDEGSFRVIGHVQLDFGSGVWDEWLLDFGGDRWAWLAEAQARFYLTREAALPPVPYLADLAPGQTVDLGPPGTFVVTEARRAKFVSAEGELPFAARPGAELGYGDLSGPRGLFATLDYGSGQEAQALYVGREVPLAELHFSGLPDEAERRVKTASKALSCPRCGGPLELRAPDQTRRVGCPWCGSLLEVGERLAVLEVLREKVPELGIPLGSKGRLEGVMWTAIGYLERSVTVEGDLYPWREYLLYEPRAGFRWLVESDGHWSFVTPVHAGDVTHGASSRGAASVTHDKQSYRHFQSATARVDRVLGELYWEVAAGQTVQVSDYVAPPHVLSEERDASEVSWSRGTYIEPEVVWKAFSLKGKPPERSGVAPNQPNPHAETVAQVGPIAAALLAASLVLHVLFAGAGGRVVHQEGFPLGPAASMGTPESALFSRPFPIARRGNVEIHAEAPLDNNWLYLDGALINEQSGEVREFDAEIEHYHGPDWSEGSRSRDIYVGGVEPGTWVLRLDPQWEPGKAPPDVSIRVRSSVPRMTHLIGVMGIIGLYPLLALWRRFRFEHRRWAESDHPMSEAS